MSTIKEDYQIDLDNLFKKFFDQIFTKMYGSSADEAFTN